MGWRESARQAIPTGSDGIYRSLAVERLWLRVEWLWQKPLPDEFDVYREWGLS
jgi:hypothetical protein